MGHHITSKDIPKQGERIATEKLLKWKTVSLVLFIVGVVASGFVFNNDTWGSGYAYSWLYAFIFFATLALGGCFWTILHHVTNSGWGVSVRRLMENLGFVFPFLAVIVLPLMIPSVQDDLYEWMNEHRQLVSHHENKPKHGSPAHSSEHGGATAVHGKTHAAKHGNYSSPEKNDLMAAHKGLLAVKLWYMNLPFWLGRVIFFFVGLGGGIWLLRRISIAQDTDENPGVQRLIRARKHACWIMPIFAVVVTFIAFDFLMGTDYKWFSTMYGVYFFAGCAMSSMALLLLLLTWVRSMGYLKVVTSSEHYHIMGKLMHAFVIFWAYVSFSQFMLIWYANITEETSYFLLRNSTDGVTNWNFWSASLVFLHFAIPFVALLPHWAKKKVGYVTFMCVYLLVVHALDLYIAVIPERGPSLSVMNKFAGQEGQLLLTAPNNAYLGDILAFITVGSFFTFILLRNLGGANIFPNRDPRILESANLHN